MDSRHTFNEPIDTAGLPPIRRARGYHLYDHHGRRYLDLELQGGRALLGHRPEGVLLELRNITARGLLGNFPSPYEGRLRRALETLLPGFSVIRVFANEERLKAALEPLLSGGEIVDPVISPVSGKMPVQKWRPLLPEGVPASDPAALVPVLPFPGSFAPAVVCFRGFSEADLPPSDPVSPALLGALARSAYSLQRAARTTDERAWARFEAPWWRRTGPYLVAECGKSEYSGLFSRLLQEGIYINPQYPGPSVAPMEYTEGELKPLRRAIADWAGKREHD